MCLLVAVWSRTGIYIKKNLRMEALLVVAEGNVPSDYNRSGFKSTLMQSVASILNAPVSSIEEKSLSISPSIEIPEEIDALIDNKMFRNKFKSLIKRGFLPELTQLAEIAKTKDKPSFWFASVTAKKNWERTLDFLRKLAEVARNAAEVMKRINVPASSKAAVYWACWQLGGTVINAAVTAQETGKKPFHLFMSLVKRQCTPTGI